MRKRALAALAVIALALAACTHEPARPISAAGLSSGHNDVNPQPADRIMTGGTMNWPLTAMPDNWNPNQAAGVTADSRLVISALEPSLFVARPNGSLVLDHDYLLSASLVSDSPMTVAYKINPRARWSNGRPISWLDFQSQWRALGGATPGYQVADTSGYSSIGNVARGDDDQDVRVSFNTKFGEWQSLFSPLLPLELNSTTNEFNQGWQDQPKITSAAFRFDAVDPVAKTVRVRRDPRWWGTPAHLDAIVFKVVSPQSLADALENGTIDFYPVGASVDLYQRATAMRGVQIRQALENKYTSLDFNGAPGATLHDQRLRVAVEKGVDTATIARTIVGKLMPGVTPPGNHFFLENNENYVDHSQPVRYDAAEAGRMLDSLGWRQVGDVRVKDGRPLRLTYVLDSGNQTSLSIATLVSSQLKAIGVQLDIEPVPVAELFKNYVEPGAFDVVAYGQALPPQPITANAPVYALNSDNVQRNLSRIGSDSVNRLLADAAAEENDQRRVALLQQADVEIWQQGHLLPLYPSPGAYATRASLANFGALGLAQAPIAFASIGFMK
jgi:peptide/nickel transport system substrate-binding protein